MVATPTNYSFPPPLQLRQDREGGGVNGKNLGSQTMTSLPLGLRID